MEKLLAGIDVEARGDRHAPPADDRARRSPTSLEPAIARAHRRRPSTSTSRAGSGARTTTLWGPAGAPEVADRLGWLTIAERCCEGLDDLLAFAQEVARRRAHRRRPARAWAARRWRPRSCARSFGPQEGWPAPARARLDRRRLRSARSRPPIDPARRCSSCRRSPAGRSRRSSLFEHFWARAAGRRAHFVAITDPGSALQKLAARARLPPHVPQRPRHRRALQRAVVLRARARGAAWAPTSRALLDGAGQAAEQACASLRPRHANCGLWLGLRARRAGARRAATSSRSSSTSRSRRSACGPSSSWPSRPASRARASCPSPTSRSAAPDDYGDDRVFVHLRNADAPDEDTTPAWRRCRDAGQPVHHARAHGGAEDLGRDLLLRRVRDGGRRLGARDQPVRPAQRAGGQGQHQARARRRAAARSRRRATTTCARWSAGWRPPPTSRSWATCPPTTEFDAAVARAARRDPRRDEGGDDVRLRPALPALDGPVPQGRPARGPLPRSCVHDAGRGRRDPRRSRTRSRPLKRAQADRRPADAAAPTACRRRVTLDGGDPAGSLRDLTERIQEALSDADRVRRARQDGRQHGRTASSATPSTTSSPSTSDGKAVRPRPRGTAATGACVAARPRQEARGAADGLDHGARPATRRSRRSTTLAELLDPGDTIVDGGNSKWTDDARRGRGAAQARASTTSTSACRGGVWGLQVGYCMMVGGPDEAVEAADADPRRAGPAAAEDSRTASAIAAGPTSGPTGAGHYVKMVHNGIEYGMMQAYAEGFEPVRRVASSSSTTPRSRTSGMQGSVVRSWLCELAGRARLRGRRATTSTRLEPYVDDSGEGRWTIEDAIERRIPMPGDHRLALRALLLARAGRLRGEGATRPCATSSAATR